MNRSSDHARPIAVSTCGFAVRQVLPVRRRIEKFLEVIEHEQKSHAEALMQRVDAVCQCVARPESRESIDGPIVRQFLVRPGVGQGPSISTRSSGNGERCQAEK